MATLLVAPTDSLMFHVEKGELKPRYFNPCDLFVDVHVLEPSELRDVPSEASVLFGSARVTLHPIGRVNWRSFSEGPLSGARTARVRNVARSVRPGVVRAYDPLAAGWAARSAARAAKVPYVVSVHTNFDIDVRRSLLRRRRWRGLLLYMLTRELVERPVLRDADALVAAYAFAAAYVRDMGRSDVRVIYNRADPRRFTPRPLGDGERLPLRVLTVGSAIPERGIDLAIRAIALTDCDLTIVSQGPERVGLERLAAELVIGHRLRFVDRVANAEMPRVFQDADVYVSPLGLGGISIPVLEAAAAGLPIIAVRPFPGIDPELVPEFGVVCDRTPDALAMAISSLARDVQRRRELGSAARDWALRRPDPEVQEAELYRTLLGARRA